MTIYERALEFVSPSDFVGLGSGHAADAFIQLLGERVRGGLAVRGVATSQATAEVAHAAGVPLVSLEEGMPLAVTIDGADEVDPNLDVIKGYGRALVREKIVAASSRRLVLLIGPGKEVHTLGDRGKLPVEVVPFALPLCRRRLKDVGCEPVLYEANGVPFVTDNGNYILDCRVGPLGDPAGLEARLRAVPGVVGTGLFLGMADVVLVGDAEFRLVHERRRGGAPAKGA
jgi:ribose 5-phosphate isomerase A